MQKQCGNQDCRKIIIRDWVKYLRENPDVQWLQCPYCFAMEKIKNG